MSEVLIQTRCTQGTLTVTDEDISVGLKGTHVDKWQKMPRSSIRELEGKIAVASLFGRGGGVNLTFRDGRGNTIEAHLVPPKDAQEIMGILKDSPKLRKFVDIH